MVPQPQSQNHRRRVCPESSHRMTAAAWQRGSLLRLRRSIARGQTGVLVCEVKLESEAIRREGWCILEAADSVMNA